MGGNMLFLRVPRLGERFRGKLTELRLGTT